MTPSSPLSVENSHWLDDFSLALTSRSQRIYNNGRQQIEVTLLVVPAADSLLSDAHYESLGLVYQTADGDWRALSQDDEHQDWFYRTEQDVHFDYYPSVVDSAVPVELPAHSPGARIKRFYIHSRAKQGESILLAGTILARDHTSLRFTEPLPLELIAEQSPRYSFPEDYEWHGKVRVGDRLFGDTCINDQAFLCEYALRPQRVAFSAAECPQPPHTPPNLMRWSDDAQSSLATVVSLALPGASAVSQEPALSRAAELSTQRITQPITSTAGQVVVMAQGFHDVPAELQPCRSVQPLTLHLYDRHGALHSLDIDFDGPDNRFDLCVRNAPHAHTQAIGSITYFKVDGRGLPYDATHCRLYNNGHQQTYIDVFLEATDEDGVITPIPESVLNDVTLVDYYTGAQLDSNYQVNRSRSAKDQRFVYYPNQQTDEDARVIPRQAQRVRFYLSTGARETKRVAARLVHGGRTYHTHDYALPAGDGRTSAGRSNCSAIIEPLAQDYFFDEQRHYQLLRYDAADALHDFVLDLDRYELRLKGETRHRLVYLNRFGSVAWRYTGTLWTHWIYICGLSGVGRTTLSKEHIQQIVNVPDTAVIFYRLIALAAWQEGSFNRELGIRYVLRDEQGNAHKVWINTSDKMNTLRL